MRRKTILILKRLAVLGLVCGFSRVAFTQSPKQDRLARPIAGSPGVRLEGNRRPMFQPENDLGPVAGSFQLENISLTFKLTESQQADLTALLAEQQDPSLPHYHQWLAPEQYADRFGLSPHDIHQVEAWLQAQGFQVTQTARGRNWVSFSGTAAQVQAAFQTEIHHFSLHGQTYYANASEPAVPAALADVVLGIRGLDNYRLKPHGVFRQVGASGAGAGPNAVRPYITDGGPQPNFTSGTSGNTFLSPGDFATIYDLQNLYNLGIDGTGQSIAIMGQTDLYGGGSDIAAFRSAAGLPPNTPTVILNGRDPGLSSADIAEASLDVEWSGAVARNATMIYVNSTNVLNSLVYAIDQDIAPVLSISYGSCEAEWGISNLLTLQQLTQQASSEGQTIVASAGDSGAAGCDYSSSTSGVTVATHGLAVMAPASAPNITAMGGSEFNEGSGNYWEAATAATGDILASALSYIPEMVWNDTSSPGNAQNLLLAGGGGASVFFPKPTWQTGPGVPNDNARDVPDLSLNASALHDGYLVCIEGNCVNGYRNTSQSLTVAGGTSAATPTFAGMVALINQQMNTPMGQGNINPILYSMAQTVPGAFHDITLGDNMVPCLAGTANCPSGGTIGYSAGVGYDQASGLGSVDAYNLVMEWGATPSGNLPAPTLSAPANGAAGVALSPTFNWSQVTGNNGYLLMIAPSPSYLTTVPTVSICAAPCTVVATSSNSNSYTPPSALAAGIYYWQVQAIPSSSSGNAGWSNIFSFTTTGGTLPAPTLSAPAPGATAVPLPPTFTWTPVTGNAGYRILIATTPSVLPINPSVGTCGGCRVYATTTAASYTPPATALVGATAYFWEVQALAPPGSGQIAAWSSVSSFTGGGPDFSLSASPSTLTISPGSSGTSTLTLTPINNFSGSMTFSCSASSSLAGVTCAVSTLGGNNTATVTISASTAATSYPALPRNPGFGRGWVAGVALLGLLPIALSRKKRLTTERTETTEKSAYACLGRDCGSLLVNPQLLSVSVLRDLCALCGERLFGLWRVALGAALAALLIASLSCGGGSSSGGGGGTTPPPESGIVTVTGTSTTTHSVQISVSVS